MYFRYRRHCISHEDHPRNTLHHRFPFSEIWQRTVLPGAGSQRRTFELSYLIGVLRLERTCMAGQPPLSWGVGVRPCSRCLAPHPHHLPALNSIPQLSRRSNDCTNNLQVSSPTESGQPCPPSGQPKHHPSCTQAQHKNMSFSLAKGSSNRV